MISDEEAKALLLARKEALARVAKSGEEAAETVELDQQRVGRLSRMEAMQAQAVAAETERRRRVELTKIEAAIKRLDQGEYGYCLDCGDDIAEERLRLDPATPLCIGCAGRAERD